MTIRAMAAGILAATFAFAALPASASFINGSITMSGDFVPVGGSTLGTATGIDFLNDDFGVDDATEDFSDAGIGEGDLGTINDFTFVGVVPAFDLWSVGGFTFNMTSTQVVFQNDWFLLLTGIGTISGNGFLETYGSWSLSANTGGSLFNFSAGTAAPEPGTMALLGLGTLGMLAGRRRRR